MIDFKKIPAWFVIVFFAGTFLIMNLLTPIFGDDYAYAFIWDGAQNGNFQNNIGKLYRVESFGDIITSQWSHYMTWGGRTVAHCLVQFFVWQGKILFDIMNALIYALLALLIYFFSTGRFSLQNLDGKIFLWIFFAMWFCLPELFQTAFWLTGSCNYLWMSVLQLLFLVPFVKKFWSKSLVPSSQFLVPIMAIVGLLAGWSNESGGAITIMLTFFAMIYFWRQKKFERWMLAGFIGLLVGYALLMLAPGNVQRYFVDLTEDAPPLYSAQMFLDNLDEGMFPLLFYDALLFLPIIGYFARGKKSVQATQFILMFTFAAMFLPVILMFAPESPVRAAFLSPVLLIIASVVAIECTDFNFLSPKIISAVFCIWLASIVYAIGVDWSIHSQIADRMKYIEAHKSDDLVVVQPIELPAITEKIYWEWTIDQYARFYGDLTPYRDKFNNRNITFAQYYGLKEAVMDMDAWSKQTQFILY